MITDPLRVEATSAQTHMTTPPGNSANVSLWYIMRHFREIQADTLKTIEWIASLGDFVKIGSGPSTVYFINHPEFTRQVLVTQASKFHKAKLLKHAFEDSIGDNVFTGDGDFWKRSRKLMSPAFHSQRIGAYADLMVDHSVKLAESWQAGQRIVAADAMMGLTMSIVTQALFNIDLSSQRAGAAFDALFEVVNERIRRQGAFQLPSVFYRKEQRAVADATHTIEATLNQLIAQRRSGAQIEDTGDLLSMLLIAADEEGGMSDAQLRHELMTLFGAGYETTAVTLTWAWGLLAQHPEVEARLVDEIQRALPDGRRATLADLAQMPYSERVVKETLRLYPTSVGISRDAVEDVDLGGGRVVRKGRQVLLSQWALHHDPRWWDDPLTFNPDRFSAEYEDSIEKYAYLPFSTGPRVCIGSQFALMEARLALITILQRWRLRFAPGYAMQPNFRFTLRPSEGLPMLVEKV